MKKNTIPLALAVLATSALSPASLAESGSLGVAPAGNAIGVGLELGAPTNLNVKLMTTPDQGVVLGVGGGIWYDASVSLHADYVWHPLAFGFNDGNFSLYFGGGGWASLGFGGPNFHGHYGFYRPYGFTEPVELGVRVPLGVSLAFNQVPIEVFAEVVPALAVFPGFGAFGQGGLGARFYF